MCVRPNESPDARASPKRISAPICAKARRPGKIISELVALLRNSSSRAPRHRAHSHTCPLTQTHRTRPIAQWHSHHEEVGAADAAAVVVALVIAAAVEAAEAVEVALATAEDVEAVVGRPEEGGVLRAAPDEAVPGAARGVEREL